MAANTVELPALERKFLVGIREVLPSLSQHSDQVLQRRIGKEKLQDISMDVFGFIRAGASGQLNDNEELALLCQVLRCLTTYIKINLQLPVTLNVLVSNIGLLEYATEQAFPGYAQARLLKYCVMPRPLVAA